MTYKFTGGEKTMNTDKLKGKLVEKRKNYNECSKALGITITAFSNKMNGHSKFNIEEVNSLANYLNLTNQEKIDIFLN